jgi:hypothetical protein
MDGGYVGTDYGDQLGSTGRRSSRQLQDVPLQSLLIRAGASIACALLVYEAGLFTRTLA